MTVGTYFAIFFIVWWTVLFAVLPWGVRSQAESEAVTPGTDPGAPVRPGLAAKMLATTAIAAVLTAALIYLATSGLVKLEDFPMPFDISEEPAAAR